jgi:hypothetical protein
MEELYDQERGCGYNFPYSLALDNNNKKASNRFKLTRGRLVFVNDENWDSFD